MDGVEKPKLIIDCGAYVGYSSVYFLNKYPESHIIAVEPDKKNFEICQKNLFPYRSRVSLIQAAVWPFKTKLIVYHDMPSKGREWGLKVKECKGEEEPCVNAVNIHDILSESDFDHIDILKIDIEKAEKEVFSNNVNKWLHKVRNIFIELHDQESEEIFFKALSFYNYTLSKSDELTVCENISSHNNV